MNDGKLILNLSDYLTMNTPEMDFSKEAFSSMEMRQGKTVYVKNGSAFKRYIDEIYHEKHIERYAYSAKEFREFLINTYIRFNGADKIEVNLEQEIERIEIKQCHVLLPIFNVHAHKAKLLIGKTAFIRFQALGGYLKENNYCSPKEMHLITQDSYFADIPFADIVVNARDLHYAFEQAQLRLDEIIHLLNFILYSSYRGLEVISSTTNSGTRERHFIVGEGWGHISVSGHPSAIKRLVLDEALDFILDKEIGNQQLIEIFDKSNKNEIEKRITNAVNWLGMAIAEKNNSIAFTQSIYAIESLLQYETKGEVINKSIVATISEAIAFLLGKNYEDRKNIEKNFKELYGIRSKIAHGKSSEITAYQVLEAINLAKRLVQGILTNSALKDASTMQKITNYITKLKYTVVNDTENN